MEENKKFPLGHTILYCKGWYEMSDNVFDDLRKTLAADGYTTEYFSDSDIAHLLLNKMDEYYELFKKANNSFGIASMYDFIERYNRIEDGFKEKPIEYKIWRFFRCYAFELYKEDFVEVEPDYTILKEKKYYTKKWLDYKLFEEFESWCFNYDYDTIKEFKKNVVNKALKQALKGLKEQYPKMIEEYGNKDRNIINLVKDEYTERFINEHTRLFDDCK